MNDESGDGGRVVGNWYLAQSDSWIAMARCRWRRTRVLLPSVAFPVARVLSNTVVLSDLMQLSSSRERATGEEVRCPRTYQPPTTASDELPTKICVASYEYS